MSMGISLFGKHTCKKCKLEGTIDLQVYKIDKILTVLQFSLLKTTMSMSLFVPVGNV